MVPASGSSDDTSFLLRKMPVISFFSGFHADYHRPSDDWEKIDVPGATEVTRIALALLNGSRAGRSGHSSSNRPCGPGARRKAAGYGPYFGFDPRFWRHRKGCEVRGRAERQSARDKAGLKKDDVMISFGGAAIANLQDFTFQLRSGKLGDVVKVIVLREGKELSVDVTLEARQ